MNYFYRSCLSFLCLSVVTTVSVYLYSAQQPELKLISCLLFSSTIWAWFSIFHSCGHQSLFKSQFLNDCLGWIISGILVIPFYSWKLHHNEHHKWTGYLDRDPTCSDIKLPKKENMKIYNLLWRLGFPIISLTHVITHLWNPYSLKRYLNNKNKFKILFSFILIPVFHVMMFIFVGHVFYIPWLAAMFLFLLTSDIILLSQHALLPMKSSTEHSKPLNVRKHFKYTRSISFGKFIDRFILLNFNEHCKHHLKPSLPHYDLNKIQLENECRVNGFEWLAKIKRMHIHDVLSISKEAGHG